jgi:hypothetical protein
MKPKQLVILATFLLCASAWAGPDLCAMQRDKWEMDKNSQSLQAALADCEATVQLKKSEKDTRTPIEIYKADTYSSLLNCRLMLKIWLLTVGGGTGYEEEAEKKKTEYITCMRDGRTSGKTAMDAALKTVKKPKAKEALKTAHVAFITALDGIFPATDERKINYAQRQSALDDKLNEAWARFEVER